MTGPKAYGVGMGGSERGWVARTAVAVAFWMLGCQTPPMPEPPRAAVPALTPQPWDRRAALAQGAVWGAELAVALSGVNGAGHVYEVAPTGPFEDDPNLTNKRFAGNPTRSFRSKAPLRVVAEVSEWTGHTPEAVAGMVAAVRAGLAAGNALIED